MITGPNETTELKELLEQLVDEEASIAFSRLHLLSDLARERLAAFKQVWEILPRSRRDWLIQALVELAEASFAVNFDAIFRYVLDDASDTVRAAAIGGLWEDEREDLIGPFLMMLRADPSPQVRAAAAKGLGHYVLAGELDEIEAPVQARIVTELLTAIYLREEALQVRRRAVEAAAYACTPETNEALALAYRTDNEEMQISAVVGMGRSCDRRWKGVILRELQSESPAMRYEATLASGELMLREAIPFLSDLIHDPDRQITNATIWALGQIGGPRAKQILGSYYEEADQDLREAIEDALAEVALAEGELEFPLYDFDELEDDDLFDDGFVALWSAEDVDDADKDWDF